MDLNEYLKKNNPSTARRVIGFLVEGDRVLLGRRKEGIGKGYYVGIGGKPEKDESVGETFVRELEEEVGVKAKEYKQSGLIRFFFQEKPDWNQEIHVYVCTEWSGKPKELEDIVPEWFPRVQLPFNKMWPDSKYWIPLLLSGVQIEADFLYDSSESICDFCIKRL